MAGLGEELRAAREARNLSLSDVSERIHIRSVYLGSLEDEDWGAVAAPVYVRGFLRTYARFLGLDPEAAVASFNASLPDSPVRDPGPRMRVSGRPGPGRAPSPWLWVGSIAALLLVGYVGFSYYQLQQTSAVSVAPSEAASPAPQPAATGDSPAKASPGTATLPGKGRAPADEQRAVVVRLVQRSWLRVAVDGAVPLEGIYPAGTQRIFHGKTVTVRAGNAGGVDVTVNGRDVGPLGADGDVVERTFTLAQE